MYDGDTLIWGTEPDGTTPSDVTPSPTEPKTDPTTEPQEEPAPSGDTGIYGDADNDGDVDIVDVLALNQYLLGVGDIKSEKNADVDENTILNDTDAMNILKSLVKLVTLPVKAS
jgi:hypothetical protein